MVLAIKGFTESSFLDWDGKVVSTVYLPGCNFRCPFCHNAGLIEKPEEYPDISREQIEIFLRERSDFIDGVCITGGEPSLHKNSGLTDFIKEMKSAGFLVKLDTNGTDPAYLRELIGGGMLDYVAMDLKAPLDWRYDRLSGSAAGLDSVRESVGLIMKSGIEYEFRTTVVPEMIGFSEIEDMAGQIAGARKFVLQQFVPAHCWDKNLRSAKPYSRQQLEAFARAAEKHVPNTVLRGV